MCLLLDNLGDRYGMLPSQVLEKADTLDLYVYDVAISFAKHEHDKKNKEPSDFYTDDVLQRAVESVKDRKSKVQKDIE